MISERQNLRFFLKILLLFIRVFFVVAVGAALKLREIRSEYHANTQHKAHRIENEN